MLQSGILYNPYTNEPFNFLGRLGRLLDDGNDGLALNIIANIPTRDPKVAAVVDGKKTEIMKALLLLVKRDGHASLINKVMHNIEHMGLEWPEFATIRQSLEAIKESGPYYSNPTSRAAVASRFTHDPDKAAVIYKPNKYDPETGLGGYVANRSRVTGDDSNIIVQLRNSMGPIAKPLTFKDGDTLEIKPAVARRALYGLEGLRPADRLEASMRIVQSKRDFLDFLGEMP
jgi:hypothetical protein